MFQIGIATALNNSHDRVRVSYVHTIVVILEKISMKVLRKNELDSIILSPLKNDAGSSLFKINGRQATQCLINKKLT